MRICSLALLCFTLPSTDSFVVPTGTKPLIRSSKLNAQNEFEYLLNENGSVDKSDTRSRRVVLPGSHETVQMTSSVAAPTEAATEEESAFETEEVELGQTSGENPYEQQLALRDAKLQRLMDDEKKNPLVDWIEDADFNEIAVTLFLPTLIGFGIFNWGFRKARARFSSGSEVGLASFANEMIYHDGNFEEMELCKKEWSGKLAWLGPKKNKQMLDSFLEDYAKRKPISPQAISSVSYVLSLFKMTEEKSADAFVSLCYRGGAERVSSANKLLFIGTQLFKNPEALAKLNEIKDMIKGTYRTSTGGDEMVKASQYAMGDAAYRNEVQKIGLTSKLPDGWQVLGLTQEKANAIYTEEKERGFQTLKDEIYSDEKFKYNEKGQRVDDDGNVIDEEDRLRNEMEAEWEDDSSASDGAFECANCGYTLFVAKGRGAKFFGAGFKCPECGAAKDQFFTPDMEEDEKPF